MNSSQKNKPRALITGATGYIGSQLTARLLAEGRYAVDILIRPGAHLTQFGSSVSELGIYEYDGTTQSVTKCMDAARPNIVFHLASAVIGEHAVTDIENLISSNVLFGTQLVEAMSRAGVTTLVNTGTYWQHFGDSDYGPVNLYSATKQAFEDILYYYAQALDLKIATLVLFDTYGPKDHRPKLLNLIIQTLQDGRALDISPGDQQVDLVHIDDVVNAFIAAAEWAHMSPARTLQNFDVRTGNLISVKELIRLVEQISKLKANVHLGARPYRRREIMTPWTKGKILPGWKAEINLSTGIHELLCEAGLGFGRGISNRL